MNLKLTVLALSLLAASCSPLAPLPNHNKFFMLSPISEEGVARTGDAVSSATLDRRWTDRLSRLPSAA